MILEAANGGATKTKIMYKAFLSYAQLKEYLSVLIENNLLEYLEGVQTYKTTEKGFNLLKMRSEEHTSELQSLMRISYAVFCLKKKNIKTLNIKSHTTET